MNIDSLMQQVQLDPRARAIVDQIANELVEDGVSYEMLDTMIQALQQVLEDPSTYPQVYEYALANGVIEEGEMPPEFDPVFVVSALMAMQEVRSRMHANPRGFAKGGLVQMAQRVQNAGREGDKILAHISPREAEVLRRMGGSGTVNPNTGLLEFKKKGGIFKKVFGVAAAVFAPQLAPVIGGALGLSGTLGSIVGGSLLGAGTAAVTGGNPLKGALTGGLGSGLSSAFGATDLGGGLKIGDAGAGVGFDQAFSGIDSAAKTAGSMGSSLGSGLSTSASLGSGVGSSLGGLAQAAGGMSGLATPGLAMESLGGLGDGISGALPSFAEAGEAAMPTYSMDDIGGALKTAKNAYGMAKNAQGIYQMMNPPEPQQPGVRMQPRPASGGMPGLAMNTNRAFGLGGAPSRGIGQMARFANGGLARYRKGC